LKTHVLQPLAQPYHEYEGQQDASSYHNAEHQPGPEHQTFFVNPKA
ncbi:MAG: hypothetical protein UY48_C0053G0016, partial [Candidatus Gottesmanbacteria bacterium GW2011_GWB1_49_7]